MSSLSSSVLPEWLLYSTLRNLCLLHGVEVHGVSSRTLYNWSRTGPPLDSIDLLCARLIISGFLSACAIRDIALSCGVSPGSLHCLELVKCREADAVNT